jgi:DNA-binding transcriptional LysR family regulator
MKLCEEQGFQAKIVQEGPHWVTIVSLVAAGLGVTIAPESIRKIAAESVVCRPLSPAGTTHIELAFRRDENSPVAREFCRLARMLCAAPPRRERVTRSARQ